MYGIFKKNIGNPGGFHMILKKTLENQILSCQRKWCFWKVLLFRKRKWYFSEVSNSEGVEASKKVLFGKWTFWDSRWYYCVSPPLVTRIYHELWLAKINFSHWKSHFFWKSEFTFQKCMDFQCLVNLFLRKIILSSRCN